MKKKYLIRLDDACPTMDVNKWERIEGILDIYGLRPLVGVIPSNKDPKQQIDEFDQNFWSKVKRWEQKGWSIAMHGYDHCFISDEGLSGLNPLWERSEFSGVSLKAQKEKIQKGIAEFRQRGFDPKYFFAPAHTYDKNTLTALLEESNIRIISDTIATQPYQQGDFVFIPQIGGHCTEIKLPGFWTFCLHPSIMSEIDFLETERFLQIHKSKMMSFDEIKLSNLKRKNLTSRLLSWAYFTKRRIKKQK